MTHAQIAADARRPYADKIRRLDAALVTAIDMLQHCMRNAHNDTAAAIDAVLTECHKAHAD